MAATGSEYLKYRGQWGGKIDSGEEMWWSEPNLSLRSSAWKRFLFGIDVRQHFLLRFWKKVVSEKPGQALSVIDYGCGTGGTTLNFSSVIDQPITGYDIFDTQLRIGNDFAKANQLRCQFKTLEKEGRIPVPQSSLDAIFSMDVLGHVPDIPKVLGFFNEALKPGGSVILFTESTYSLGDHSLMHSLAQDGFDIVQAVPEHISLFPRETLEEMFRNAGFEVIERYSANVWHFFFFPKDYFLILKGKKGRKGVYFFAKLWDRISKVLPFYPWPFQLIRLGATYLFGKDAFGTAYFYHLKKS